MLLPRTPGLGNCVLPTNIWTLVREINSAPYQKLFTDAGTESDLQYSQKGRMRKYSCARTCVDLLCVWSAGFRYNKGVGGGGSPSSAK